MRSSTHLFTTRLCKALVITMARDACLCHAAQVLLPAAQVRVLQHLDHAHSRCVVGPSRAAAWDTDTAHIVAAAMGKAQPRREGMQLLNSQLRRRIEAACSPLISRCDTNGAASTPVATGSWLFCSTHDGKARMHVTEQLSDSSAMSRHLNKHRFRR